MKTFIATVTLVFALAACVVAPKTPAQSVYAIESNYAAALTLAVAYKRLPLCSETTTMPCSDIVVVRKLQRADTTAITFLEGAQTAVRSNSSNSQIAIDMAASAVAALTQLTSTLGVK